MKKCGLIFIILCIAACFIPFVGMTVRPTTVSTENKRMAEFPEFMTEEGTWNTQYFQEFENWFNEHFAFRNELVYADAKVQTSVFGVSNVDTVTYGSDGWLYYTSTLGDYLGTNRMSDRQIYNLVHNLSLVYGYVEENGSKFLLTIPPNKNTLYDKDIPYYDSYIIDDVHNVDLLKPALEDAGIPYADLVNAFRDEDEVLYLKRDSHWNMKGAVLAYNRIMDALEQEHDDYAGLSSERVKDEDGDLNRMLYTLYGEKEYNFKYDVEQNYSYVNEVQSVEDGWIETECGSGEGTLLMFRDSFGNTLIPLIANQFENAWFTKAVPYALEKLMEEYHPDTVVLEKVERNLSEYITMPPIISAPETDISQIAEQVSSGTTIEMGSYDFDFNYYKISGIVDENLLNDTTDIIVQVNGRYYEAYHLNDCEYEVFLKKEDVDEFPVNIGVLTKEQDLLQLVQIKTIDEGELLQ